jgi:hypothetical protein
MPTRSQRAATERAEARRRARLATRGEEVDPDTEADEADASDAARRPAPAGGSFLNRLFPPAPPLPGKEEPLKGFAYDGPLPGVVAGLYLLSRNPLAWLGMGAVWGVAGLAQILGGDATISLFTSLAMFASLIGAGWIGWQRPWLFGLAASIIGILIPAVTLALAAMINAADILGGANAFQIFANYIIYQTLSFQPFFGLIAGWYGGYLRRRMATGAQPAGRATRTRRR